MKDELQNTYCVLRTTFYVSNEKERPYLFVSGLPFSLLLGWLER